MRQTKWLSEQVNADGPLNGSDRERAVKGSTLEKEMTQKQWVSTAFWALPGKKTPTLSYITDASPYIYKKQQLLFILLLLKRSLTETLSWTQESVLAEFIDQEPES